MTQLFSALTVFALFLVAVYAQFTGMPAMSYFGLMAAFASYALWLSRKNRFSALARPVEA